MSTDTVGAVLDHPTRPPAEEAPPAGGDRHRWYVLAVLGLAQLMVVLDSTVVNIALPSAQRSLGFSNDDRQWIVTAYALAFGSLLLLGGRLGDLMGRKRAFLIGLVGFAAASALGGLAQNFTTLVGARAVQGAFGALLAPAGLSLLSTTFTEAKERSRAFAIYGSIAGAGAAVGLLLGGVLTEYLSWRWCMFVNIAFAAAAFGGGLVFLSAKKVSDRVRLDVPGILLVSAGLFSVVFGFAHAETAGWGATETIVFLIAGAALLGAFVVTETRVASPVLPMRVVLDRYRGGAYIAILMIGAGMFGIFLFLTFYLQQNLGFSAVKSGLAFMPMVLAIGVASQASASLLSTRVGPRFITPPGLLMAGIGLLLLTRIDANSHYLGSVLPGLVIFGAGLGLVFSSAISLGTAGVASEDAGAASAMVTTAQQVGGSIGTALLSTLAASSSATYIHSHAAGPHLASLAGLQGYLTAFQWSAGILLVGAVLTAFILPAKVPEFEESEIPTLG